MTQNEIEKSLFNRKETTPKKQTKSKKSKFDLNGFCLLDLNDLYVQYNLKPLSLKELVIFSLLHHLYNCYDFDINDKTISNIRYNTNFSKNLILNLLQSLASRKFIEINIDNTCRLNLKLVQLNLPQIIFVEREIICNKSLSFNERMVLCYLKSYSDTYDKCISKSETIAKNLNLGIVSVKTSITKLEKLELIFVKYNKRQGNSMKGREITVQSDKVYDLYTNYKDNKINHTSIRNQVLNISNVSNKQEISVNNINSNNVNTNSNNLNIDHLENHIIIMDDKNIVPLLLSALDKNTLTKMLLDTISVEDLLKGLNKKHG